VKAVAVHPLLSAPVSGVTLEMVEDFVSLGIPENLTVEYKREGDKPAEAAAALANTYGGVVLVGVSEGDRGIPQDIVGVSRKEKEKLVNRMGTTYDPPWSPDVIEVALRDSDKVVLVLRIDPDRVPKPIVMDGAIWIRLDGRNVKANRQMMAALLAEARTGRATHQAIVASRSPNSHQPIIDPNDLQDQDLQLRAVTSVPIPPVRRRTRLPIGMPDKLTSALSQTDLYMLTKALAGALGADTQGEPTSWQVTRTTSKQIVLDVSSARMGPGGGRASALCRVLISVRGNSLEVITDMVLWQGGRRLEWRMVQLALLTMATAVGGVLLPEAFTVVVGPATLTPPAVEIHVSTYRYGVQDRPVEDLVDVSPLGERTNDGEAIRGGNEFLDETLVDNGEWAPAVIDALTTMAMDWGFPSPDLGQRAEL
jgi:hypothetical protein